MTTFDEFFKGRVKRLANGCLMWQGYCDRDGYGRAYFEGGCRGVHRVALQLTRGESVPVGLEIDHACFNRACVEPTHLRLVTHAENIAATRKAQATHCKQGHEFTPENTYVRSDGKGRRVCRTCNRAAAAKYARKASA